VGEDLEATGYVPMDQEDGIVMSRPCRWPSYLWGAGKVPFSGFCQSGFRGPHMTVRRLVPSPVGGMVGDVSVGGRVRRMERHEVKDSGFGIR
jgi:hypothetical protein